MMGSESRRKPQLLDRKLSIFFAINITLIGAMFLGVALLSSGTSGKMPPSSLSADIISTNFIYLGFLALFFGLRHAIDADHIAAIDTSTRKLRNEGKKSEFTGLFFSLGHSTIVILMSVVLMFSTRFVIERLPSMETMGSIIGPLISAAFLFIMAAINISIILGLRDLYKRKTALGSIDLNSAISGMGLLNRLFRGLFKSVKNQYYLYPIGILFGLGFDTASEVLILSISAVLAVSLLSVPVWVLLIFPALFTLGMSLIDTTDGYTMNRAYAWASNDPAKKLWYNITLTSISAIFAVTAAVFELFAVVASNFKFSGYPWSFFTNVSNNYWDILGGIIIATLALIVVVSYIKYRKSFKSVTGNESRS